MPGQAAFALDQLKHGGFFATDVSASSPPKVDFGVRDKIGGFDSCNLAREDLAAFRIFIAKVDVNCLRLDRPRPDQHAFEDAVRIGFDMIAILESPRLSFICVHRHHPRAGFGADELPLPPYREARPAKPAKARIFKRFDYAFRRSLSGQAFGQQVVAAVSAVMIEIDIRVQRRVPFRAQRGSHDTFDGRIFVERVAHRRDWCIVTSTHAWRADNANAGLQPFLQGFQQFPGTHQRAGQAIADAHSHRRRRRFAVHDDIEMRIKRSDFEHLHEREAHFLRKRDEMTGMQAAVSILQEMQVLDKQVGLARALAQDRPNLADRDGVRLPPARKLPRLPAAGAWMNAAAGLCAAWLRHSRIVNVHGLPALPCRWA